MASHHTDSHGLFLLSRRYLFATKYSFVTRIVTDDLFVPNYRIFLHTENHGRSRRIFLSRICELANYSSHGESRMFTEDLFVTNLRIVLHTDGHGESRRISFITKIFLLSHGESRRVFLSRICELANFSSHGESRTVTEDLFVTNLRIVLHTDGHGESRRISMA